jgi:predicted phosphodiesterase
MSDLLPTSRRQLLRQTAAGLAWSALCARWAAAADHAKPAEEFTFAVLNDLHYFNKDCSPWFHDRVVKRLNDQKPDFVIVVGDMTEDGTREQNAGVRDVLKALAMPLYVAVGNHDHQANTDDRKPFEDAFPKSINYHFEHKGWQFITLDSTQGRAASKTKIQKDTITYLADTLKVLDRKKPTALVTHFPLGFLMPYRPENGDDLLFPFANHTLLHVFNGHFHSNTQRAWGDATLSTNTCCSRHRKNHDFDPRKGYTLCTTKDNHIAREYIQVNV